MLGPTHYAIGLAVLPEQRDVIIVGQPLTKGSPACIAAIGLDEPHPLKGPWSRPRTTTASCIAMLPGGRQFAVGRYLFSSKSAQNLLVHAPDFTTSAQSGTMRLLRLLQSVSFWQTSTCFCFPAK